MNHHLYENCQEMKKDEIREEDALYSQNIWRVNGSYVRTNTILHNEHTRKDTV